MSKAWVWFSAFEAWRKILSHTNQLTADVYVWSLSCRTPISAINALDKSPYSCGAWISNPAAHFGCVPVWDSNCGIWFNVLYRLLSWVDMLHRLNESGESLVGGLLRYIVSARVKLLSVAWSVVGLHPITCVFQYDLICLHLPPWPCHYLDPASSPACPLLIYLSVTLLNRGWELLTLTPMTS